MLDSKDLRKRLSVLLMGSSLLAGCTSGPGTSFTRFWPDRQQSTADDDEALARKWRERMRIAGGSADEKATGAETSRNAESERSLASRFNLFRRFQENDETQKREETAESPTAGAERTADIRDPRIATVSGQQGYPRYNLNDPARAVDPFLQADQQPTAAQAPLGQRRLQPSTLPIRPAAPVQPTPQTTAVAATEDALPEWARDTSSGVKPRAAAPQTPAVTQMPNTFTSGFDRSLQQLQRSAEAPQPNVATAAPAPQAPGRASVAQVPTGDTPVITPARKPTAQTTTPAEEKHPLTAAARTVEVDEAERHRARAALEVTQLMKRTRIQARAGQYEEALVTAVAAEQLATNAQVRFALYEQTPTQLITLVKNEWEQAKPAVPEAPQVKPAATQVAETPREPAPAKSEDGLPQWIRSGQTADPAPKHPLTDGQVAAVETPAAKPVAAKPQTAKLVDASTDSGSTAASSKPATKSEELPVWATGNKTASSSRPAPRFEASEKTGSTGTPARFIGHSTIYDPENMKWSSIDTESLDDDFGGADVVPAADAVTEGDISPDAERAVTDAPLPAPAVPDGEPSEAAASTESGPWGVPLKKIGLVCLAALILLAAIVHRRRNMPMIP